MHSAIDALRAAKTSSEPVKDLEEALRRFQTAAHNKAGYRVDAMEITKRAIAAFRDGRKIEGARLVDAALEKAEKGVTSGHR